MRSGVRVVAPAPLLLQVEDEGPEVSGLDLVYLVGKTVAHQEVIKVVQASQGHTDALGALTLGAGTEVVAGGQAGEIEGTQAGTPPLTGGGF